MILYPRHILVATLAIGLLIFIVIALAATMILHLVVLRVPYIPTSRAIVQAMVQLARLQGRETVIDLGAGDGRILIEAVRSYPGITAIGIEYVPTVWLLGTFVIWRSRIPVTLRLGDALTADVANADVIFLYVLPSLMHKLEQKFQKELRKGTVIVSHSFSFPGRRAEEEVVTGGKTIRRYVW